jgi:signal transduction histidine kinase
MTDRPAATLGGEWHWLWEAYVVGLLVSAMIAVTLLQPRFGGHVLPAVVALALMVVCVEILGRWALRRGERRWHAIALVGLIVTLWVLALIASPVSVAAVPALYPLFFATLPLGPALVVTTAVNLAPLSVALLNDVHSPNLGLAIALTLIGLVAAPVVGTVIVTSIAQRKTLAGVVTELAASRAETARLSRQAGAAAERERLSREIHDTLAQGFTSIVALAQAVEAELDTDPAAAAAHVELIAATARENLAEAREMVTGLNPAALNQDSLPGAIRRHCQRFTAETGTPVAVHIEDNLPALGIASDVVLLRATQEALANVRKHADATAVEVSLRSGPGVVRMMLSDNGIGLPHGHSDGFGLRGIRARVSQVGGTVAVSSPGAHANTGVRIDIEVPT